MLSLKVLLLFLAAALAIRYGPFASGDSAAALATGLLLVSAMAIQNAAHRFHMGSSPPTTFVTGSTTQIMIDLADLARNPAAMTKEACKAAHTRFKRLGSSVAAFAIGCAAGAILYVTLSTWCFLVPAGLGVITLILRFADIRVISSRRSEATRCSGRLLVVCPALVMSERILGGPY
jgi:uncharacterized membrane protein YoaK (UPF0700 family)